MIDPQFRPGFFASRGIANTNTVPEEITIRTKYPKVRDSDVIYGDWIYNVREERFAKFYGWTQDRKTFYINVSASLDYQITVRILTFQVDDWVVMEPHDIPWAPNDHVYNTENPREFGYFLNYTEERGIRVLVDIKHGRYRNVPPDEVWLWKKGKPPSIR